MRMWFSCDITGALEAIMRTDDGARYPDTIDHYGEPI